MGQREAQRSSKLATYRGRVKGNRKKPVGHGWASICLTGTIAQALFISPAANDRAATASSVNILSGQGFEAQPVTVLSTLFNLRLPRVASQVPALVSLSSTLPAYLRVRLTYINEYTCSQLCTTPYACL